MATYFTISMISRVEDLIQSNSEDLGLYPRGL